MVFTIYVTFCVNYYFRDCCDESIDIKTFLKQTEEHIQEGRLYFTVQYGKITVLTEIAWSYS
jgi:hypothetical protein